MARMDKKPKPKRAPANKRDINSNSDDLWNRIGKRLKSKGVTPADVGKAIKTVRREK